MSSIAHIIRRRKRRRTDRRSKVANSQSLLWGIAGTAALSILVPAVFLFGDAINAYARANQMLPNPRQTIAVAPLIGASEIYDSSGTTLLVSVADSLGEQRVWLTLAELPEAVVRGTLMMEDADYLTTPRLNLLQAIGELLNNNLKGPLPPDPTLTGRLVRNAISTPPEIITVEDRALEIALVAEVNRLYTPEEVLEWHLNTNYYGNQTYGIEAAAQIYLGKSARDLTLDEAALLVSIPTAPQYNPVDDLEATRSRQRDVLQRLLGSGTITQNAYESASNTVTIIRPDAGQSPLVAPDFARYARRQAESILTALGRDGAGLVSRGGLRITTTLDLDLYYQTECLLRYRLEQLSGRDPSTVRSLDDQACISAQFLPPVQLALPNEDTLPPDSGIIVILDVNTGEIKAMVGAGTETAYQPGPTLQPFIYLDAFTNLGGSNNNLLFTPATMVLDIPRQFPGAQDGLLYIPNNVDGLFFGPMNLRDAMATGRLLPVMQVANERGLNSALRNTATPMGINSLNDNVYDLSLLEKGGAVSVLDTAYAYSVFAGQGYITGRVINQPNPDLRQHDPVAVRRIEDANGVILWEYGADQAAANRVPKLQSELPYLVNDILSDTTSRLRILGDVEPLAISRRAAVMNGVTGDRHENWTVGYTPQIVTVVHLSRGGADDPDRFALALSPDATEGAGAIWQAVMEYAHIRDNLPVLDWERPPTIIEQTVCDVSGLLPTDACAEHRHTEIFPDGYQPRTPDTYWQIVEVNSQTNQRATANTDPALKRAEVYFIPPPEALDWWGANNRPLPPEEYDTVSRPDAFQSTVITLPENYAYVGGQVEIRGSLNPVNLQYYQLAYGATISPREWTDITPQQATFDPNLPLGIWDTTGLDGLYSLRLTTVLTDNNIETSVIYVTVDNIPPSVVFTSPVEGQVYRWPTEGVIPVRVLVQDNIRIGRVVFYQYGQEVGIRDDCATLPDDCGFDFEMNRAGVELFTVEVFDSVGNSSTAEISVEVSRN